MPDSTWKIGTTVPPSTITWPMTNAEAVELLGWLIKDLTPPEGLTAAQLNEWKLNEAHKEGMRVIMREIKKRKREVRIRQRQQEFLAASQADIDAIRAEKSIIDDDEEQTGPPLLIPPV